MADKRAVGHAYNIDFLNVVFAASNILLLISVLWMVWDDYDRDWKNYQRRFVQLETEVTRVGLAAAMADVDAAELARLQGEHVAAELALAAQQDQITALEEQEGTLDTELTIGDQRQQFAKATYDVDKYAFEVDREGADPASYAGREADIDAQYDAWLELWLEVERVTAERDGVRAQLADLRRGVTDLDDQIGELTSETTRLEGQVDGLAPSFVEDYLLNAPLIDSWRRR